MVGLLLERLVGATDFDLWPWVVASGIPFAIGLARLSSRTRWSELASWLVRAARMAAIIGGTGAFVYVAATLGARVATVFGVAFPAPLEALFMLGALAFSAGVTVGSVLSGVGALRDPAFANTIGAALLLCAGLLSIPFLNLIGMSVAEWIPAATVMLFALVSIVIGYLLRFGEFASHGADRIKSQRKPPSLG